MIENIKEPQPYLTIFPPPREVFADPVELYARHIIPLLSISLAKVNPAWKGLIHLVCPLEPSEGYLGDHTSEFHNDYLRPNWIGFKLNADNKYELLGDLRFFLLENLNAELLSTDSRNYLTGHYRSQTESYALAKHCVKQYGNLRHSLTLFSTSNQVIISKDTPLVEGRNLLDRLGGNAPDGNWVENSEGVTVNGKNTDDIYPVTPDGKRFYFIACVPGYHYLYSGADSILLFFEPESRTALLTFDYT
jgi:hypothetical protein